MEKKLLKSEQTIQKIMRNVFKDSTLDYTVQMSVSSVEPGQIKYAALISSPSRGVQDVPFRFDTYEGLQGALEKALKEFKYEDIEKTEVRSRINVYKNKIAQLEEYYEKIEKQGLNEEGFLNETDVESEALAK